MNSRAVFGPILFLAVLVASCGGGPAAVGTTVPRTPTDRNLTLVDQMVIDIAEVRQLDAPLDLKISVVSRAELPKLLAGIITDQDREQLAETTTLYRLLGHFEDDQDYLEILLSFGSTGVLGLYSPFDDEMWVVSDAGTEALDDLTRVERETLAHELVHAIQDFHFPLDESFDELADDLDASLAFTALVEGDATAHEEIYSERFLHGAWGGRLFFVARPSQAPRDVPLSFIREMLFPYTTGAGWVRELLDRYGVDLINQYLEDFPSSTALVLHPGLIDDGFVPAEMDLPDLAATLGPGWVRESGGTFGEFQLRNYIQLGLTGSRAAQAAAGWTGDHYDVYASRSESGAAFVIRFSTHSEADQFVEEHASMLDGRAGGDVIWLGDVDVYETGSRRFTVISEADGTDVSFAIGTSEKIALDIFEGIDGLP